MDEETFIREYLLLPALDDAPERWIEYYHMRYRRGDQRALLNALFVAANHRIVIPQWAATEFAEAMRKMRDCRSWDEVFGRPHPKGKHIASGKDSMKSFSIHADVTALHDKDKRPIDVALFEEVGRKYGVGTTLCSKLYYEEKRLKEMGARARARKANSTKF